MVQENGLMPGEFYCELLFSSDGLEGINMSIVDKEGNAKAKRILKEMLEIIKKHNNGILSAIAGAPVTDPLGYQAKQEKEELESDGN